MGIGAVERLSEIGWAKAASDGQLVGEREELCAATEGPKPT